MTDLRFSTTARICGGSQGNICRRRSVNGALLHPGELPGSDQLEYMLMTPFTPQNRDNMISWMAGVRLPPVRKDALLQLPKEKLVYGPKPN